jgi:hypothetical protein
MRKVVAPADMFTASTALPSGHDMNIHSPNLAMAASLIFSAFFSGCGSTPVGSDTQPPTSRTAANTTQDSSIKHIAILRDYEVGTLLNSALNLTCIQGVTVYFGWRALEPQKGVLQLDTLLAAINAAHEAGKDINIAVLTGRWVPDYVLQDPSIPQLTWTQHDSYTENGELSQATAPVPWGATYDTYFSDFIGRLSNALDGLPINSVSITGGSNVNGLETDLIAGDSEIKRIGFTRGNYEHGWKSFIDAFATSFPSTRLTLALNDTFGSHRRTDIPQDLISYASARYGDRIYAQTDAFTGAAWFNPDNQYAGLVLDGMTSGAVFQAIEIYSYSDDLSGYEAMLAKARSYHPTWLEIWNADVKHFGCSAIQ